MSELQEIDMTGMGMLFSVVAASFVSLGVIIYMFGDDQSGALSVANSPPPMMTERAMRNRNIEVNTLPTTIGQHVTR